MRLAIVIPCYNHAHYIEAAIRSVLDQTRPVDRLIVIDDGSRDDSVRVIRAMNEPLVELVEQENRNAFNAINRGVEMAAMDCDAVAVLNSDDHYHPQRFEKMMPLLEGGEGAAVACSALNLIDDDDRPLAFDHPRARWFEAAWSVGARDDLDMASWMGLCNFPATTSNILARADYMRANPFKPYHYNHDYYFLSGAALRGRLVLHPERLVNYRVHATNTMNTKASSLMREVLRQQVDFLRDFHGEMADDAEMRRRYKLYMAAAFDNVSAFHAGLFLHVLGGVLAGCPEEETRRRIQELEEESFPELAAFPNRHHVGLWRGDGPVGADGSLAEKLDGVRGERDRIKEAAAAWKELAALVARISGDRRYALARCFGLAPRLDRLEGKTPQEKLAALKARLAGTRWLREPG